MWDKHGTGFLDEGTDIKNLQPYYDADWIVHAHNDSVEDDVDALLAEIASLKSRS